MQTKHARLGECPGIGTASRHVRSVAAFVDRLYYARSILLLFFFFFWRPGRHMQVLFPPAQ